MPEQEKTKMQETLTPLLPLTAAVAEKAKVSLATVESIFAQAKVVEEVGTRRSEFLTIRSLMFSGEKSAAASDTGPFTFEWSGLDTGLWLVLSNDRNQIGKSTILEVMFWALRGSTRGLRPEMRASIQPLKVLSSEAQGVFGDFGGHISIQRSSPRWADETCADRAKAFLNSLPYRVKDVTLHYCAQQSAVSPRPGTTSPTSPISDCIAQRRVPGHGLSFAEKHSHV
ncbi:hypothetical protein [Paraburkholderia sediminicola]|uniref:hypothetical protein n=1 Tax=Paraburkholderia sediminicola TaxID=458836 RepID=UPI0038BA018B